MGTINKGENMLNKIISIILIMSFSSFLLSTEVKTISDKEKSKLEEKQIKEESKTKKESGEIERKKTKKLKKLNQINSKKKRPGKIKGKKDSEKKEQIQLLKKFCKSNKLEIKNRYRNRIEGLKKSGNNSTLRNSNSELIKQLKSELRMELETLKKDCKYKSDQIKNNN